MMGVGSETVAVAVAVSSSEEKSMPPQQSGQDQGPVSTGILNITQQCLHITRLITRPITRPTTHTVTTMLQLPTMMILLLLASASGAKTERRQRSRRRTSLPCSQTAVWVGGYQSHSTTVGFTALALARGDHEASDLGEAGSGGATDRLDRITTIVTRAQEACGRASLRTTRTTVATVTCGASLRESRRRGNVTTAMVKLLSWGEGAAGSRCLFHLRQCYLITWGISGIPATHSWVVCAATAAVAALPHLSHDRSPQLLVLSRQAIPGETRWNQARPSFCPACLIAQRRRR